MSAYEEIIHWKPNIFLIPYWKAGRSFVQELARLHQAFKPLLKILHLVQLH